MEKQKILVILGPTATGKSALAVKLAKKYNGEIISADSRQVYKGLNIGTGKITEKEKQGIHHWLLDVVSPQKTFSVSEWKKLAEERIGKILKRHKLPIICGGTGFYIQSIVDNIILPEVPPNKTLRTKLSKKTLADLQVMLIKLDKDRFENIAKEQGSNNPVRLIRAIEIARSMGKVPKISKGKSNYKLLQIGINLPDVVLREKIKERLISRLKKGMIKEAQNLHKRGLSFKRMNELGLEYRYLAMYLESKQPLKASSGRMTISKDELIKKLETEIWRYSKRQMTWFKRDSRIKWFNPKEITSINKEIKNFLLNS